jgi:hypothetical protein
MTEPIATVRVFRDGARSYTLDLELRGATVTVRSRGYSTIGGALDTAAALIAEDERLRAEERIRLGCPEVP